MSGMHEFLLLAYTTLGASGSQIIAPLRWLCLSWHINLAIEQVVPKYSIKQCYSFGS